MLAAIAILIDSARRWLFSRGGRVSTGEPVLASR
jgi:hypothetical protein